MITFQNLQDISPIILSILLIVYLGIIELGDKKLKKILTPFIIVLIVIFALLAIKSVYETYSKIK